MNTGLRGALAAAGLVLGCAAAGSTAKADPITATYEGVSPGIGNAGQANWNTGGTTYPGILYAPTPSSPNHFISFCIERSQGLATGTHTYDLSTLGDGAGPAMNSGTVTALQSMWAEYRSDLDTNEESAAFQHAIWRLLDSGYDPGLSGALAALYRMYLDSTTWQSGLARLGVLSNPNLQDQLVELTPPSVEDVLPTPAPPTLVVALLIAPALLLRRRRAGA